VFRRKRDPFHTDWDKRGLFRKRHGWAGKARWLALAVVVATVVVLGQELPTLLLSGFKAIAHLAPQPDVLEH
jgi:hypothetical protein